MFLFIPLFLDVLENEWKCSRPVAPGVAHAEVPWQLFLLMQSSQGHHYLRVSSLSTDICTPGRCQDNR